MAGTVVLGAVAPAQAAISWNGTTLHTGTYHVRPADTGWNGT